MYLPKHRPPTSPGEFLLEEWLKPLKMTQRELAKKMGVDIQLVNGIIRGRRAVTAKTALLLDMVLNTGPDSWLNAQRAVDLWYAQKALAKERPEYVIKWEEIPVSGQSPVFDKLARNKKAKTPRDRTAARPLKKSA